MQAINNLEWSPPTDVKTKNGIRRLRTAPPSDGFWAMWKAQKKNLQGDGYTVAKDDVTGGFVVKHWASPDAHGTFPASQETLDHPAVRALTSTFEGSVARERPRDYPNRPLPEVYPEDYDDHTTPMYPPSRDHQRPLDGHPNAVAKSPWEFRPELPPQGYRGMAPRDRFEFKLKQAAVEALETEMVSREGLIDVMREIAMMLKS